MRAHRRDSPRAAVDTTSIRGMCVALSMSLAGALQPDSTVVTRDVQDRLLAVGCTV